MSVVAGEVSGDEMSRWAAGVVYRAMLPSFQRQDFHAYLQRDESKRAMCGLSYLFG